MSFSENDKFLDTLSDYAEENDERVENLIRQELEDEHGL